ncbi:MAG TPA: TMEM175 family protein, partial [Casimicrobiaceae bacterium]|nr:TMEM175 family protein [Casimicrobiaceae bacterium]
MSTLPIEPTPKRVRGFEKNRLEALADGIFAVALTLLVLDIKVPEKVVFA